MLHKCVLPGKKKGNEKEAAKKAYDSSFFVENLAELIF